MTGRNQKMSEWKLGPYVVDMKANAATMIATDEAGTVKKAWSLEWDPNNIEPLLESAEALLQSTPGIKHVAIIRAQYVLTTH